MSATACSEPIVEGSRGSAEEPVDDIDRAIDQEAATESPIATASVPARGVE